MSTAIAKNFQVGADPTPANNFTIRQPVTPDGTVRIANGNSGTTTDLVTLTSAGNLGVGTGSPSTYGKFAVVAPASQYAAGLSAASTGGVYYHAAFYNTTTQIGYIASDGTNFGISANGASAGITFTANGSERMRIDSSGNLGLGVTPSAWAAGQGAMQFKSGGLSAWALGGFNGYLYSNAYYDGSNNRYVNNGFACTYAINNNSGIHAWFTAPSGTAGNAISFTQAMTLDASGNLLVGTTNAVSSSSTFLVNSAKNALVLANGATADSTVLLSCIKAGATNNTSQRYIGFSYNGGGNGNGGIAGNGDSQATFITLSDERLKENIENLPTQLDNIMALRPVEFDYKATGGHQVGFIAQEVQAVYPDLVAQGDDGYLTLAGFDKNTARLVKAIQEQQAMIEQLKAEFDAYKATHP